MSAARAPLLAAAAALAAALAAGLSCGRDEICHGAGCERCPPGGCASSAGVIHRSVGPGSSTPLASGEGNELRIAGSVATFARPLPDRIGVGDALVSTFGETTTIAFITRRRSATAYELQAPDGGAPPDAAGSTTTWHVYRAYTSLADAAARIPNPGIPSALAGFDAGTSSDLVALGRIWSIACYADAIDAADDRFAVFERWNTSALFYLRIHAPDDAAEVGTSQRHRGVRDPTRYTLRKSSNVNNGYVGMLKVMTQYARIEGLQLVDDSDDATDAALGIEPTGPGEIRVAGNLFFGNPANAQPTDGVVPYGGRVASTIVLYDNVVAGMSRAGLVMNAYADNPLQGGLMARLYNNTFHGSPTAVDTGHARVVAINNAFVATQHCVNEVEPLDPTSDHNLCSRDEVMTGARSRSGVIPAWVAPGAGDFHLSPADVAAAGQGADLSANPAFPFRVDFEGQLRAGAWDIGADQR